VLYPAWGWLYICSWGRNPLLDVAGGAPYMASGSREALLFA
jgi:hypothetical protein